MKAGLLVTHGSRSEKSTREVARLAQVLKKQSGLRVLEYAFLDVARPSILEGIEACARQGATEVVILQNFLNSGNHVLKDIPAIVHAAKKKYPKIRFRIKPPIGLHPKIKNLYLEYLK